MARIYGGVRDRVQVVPSGSDIACASARKSGQVGCCSSALCVVCCMLYAGNALCTIN